MLALPVLTHPYTYGKRSVSVFATLQKHKDFIVHFSLIKKSVVLNDLELLVTFHEAFLFPHFRFLHLGDLQTGNKASFLCRHITIRYFLMIEDLESMQNNK